MEERLNSSRSKIFRVPEAAEYLGVSRSQIYKLTRERLINISKPGGKIIYISQESLDAYALSNGLKTVEQIGAEASHYLSSRKS
ncbi:helix-turn-helix domain-containing protein [Pontibacter sp. KCTC 32443]|uniref:helix-turn-helix domain-containing protein n=1 Tax=Pontibacter TaxID=323449 RepID=UPI00164EBE80|nr:MULTISPECIES: helix-turn-helix domain-containing protein [Pontibacter]MBC5773133.1 helix-turn-helix domain-containing protein [Pontibacter sp. KCTC 32443]